MSMLKRYEKEIGKSLFSIFWTGSVERLKWPSRHLYENYSFAQLPNVAALFALSSNCFCLAIIDIRTNDSMNWLGKIVTCIATAPPRSEMLAVVIFLNGRLLISTVRCRLIPLIFFPPSHLLFRALTYFWRFEHQELRMTFVLIVPRVIVLERQFFNSRSIRESSEVANGFDHMAK